MNAQGLAADESFQLPTAAIDRVKEIGPTTFFVYAGIASHADERGECRLAIIRLAIRWKMSRRTVQRCVKRLESAKMLSVVPQRDEAGRHSPHLFQLLTIPPTPGDLTDPDSEANEC